MWVRILLTLVILFLFCWQTFLPTLYYQHLSVFVAEYYHFRIFRVQRVLYIFTMVGLMRFVLFRMDSPRYFSIGNYSHLGRAPFSRERMRFHTPRLERAPDCFFFWHKLLWYHHLPPYKCDNSITKSGLLLVIFACLK